MKREVLGCKNYDGECSRTGAQASARLPDDLDLMTPDGRPSRPRRHTALSPPYRMHQQGKATSTNPIASIFAWTGGLKYRGKFDGTPEVTRFAETLERVCVETVESGKMTKDLAILVGPDQAWMTTEQFFEAIRVNLEAEMAVAA